MERPRRPNQIGDTRTRLNRLPMPDLVFPRLRNQRAADGAPVCPECNEPIALNVGAKFRDGYALHVRCISQPTDTDAG